MKREQEDKLFESYRQGKSSLEEEKILREGNLDINAPEAEWFRYAAENRKEAPAELEKQIINTLKKTQGVKRRLNTILFSSAAIIVIVVSLALLRPWQRAEMDYERKVALYQEALDMIESAEPESVGKEIIYEDETMIIYLETEKY